MNLLGRIILIGAVLFSSVVATAKTGSDHVADMHAVFGKSRKYNQLNDLFFAITRKMDERGSDNLNAQLKALSNNHFSEGRLGHRIFFHWGFNGDPKDSPALVRQINSATTNTVVREQMFEVVREVHIRRKKEILLQVQVASNALHDRATPLNRQEMNAIAALAYDVHIIGDYIEGKEGTVKALLKPEKIYEDVQRAFKLFVKYDAEFRDHPNRKEEVKKFLRELKRMAIRQDAGGMLKLMKKSVPGLLLMTGRVKRAFALYTSQEEKRG